MDNINNVNHNSNSDAEIIVGTVDPASDGGSVDRNPNNPGPGDLAVTSDAHFQFTMRNMREMRAVRVYSKSNQSSQ